MGSHRLRCRRVGCFGSGNEPAAQESTATPDRLVREGTLAEAVVGEQRLPPVVAGTGGWREYQYVDVGLVDLTPNRGLPIRVVPMNIRVGAEMNLRSVLLTTSVKNPHLKPA
jgi:hypothetical protein